MMVGWQEGNFTCNKCSAVAEMGDRLATTDMGRNVGEGAVPLRVKLGPHLTQCCPGRGIPSYQWHLDPSSRLATTNMGQKLGGGCVPFCVGELGPHLAQCGLGRGLLPYRVAFSSIQPFGHNTHGPKTRGRAPFRGPRHNVAGPRPTSVPSVILIHPAVWPQ